MRFRVNTRYDELVVRGGHKSLKRLNAALDNRGWFDGKTRLVFNSGVAEPICTVKLPCWGMLFSGCVILLAAVDEKLCLFTCQHDATGRMLVELGIQSLENGDELLGKSVSAVMHNYERRRTRRARQGIVRSRKP